MLKYIPYQNILEQNYFAFMQTEYKASALFHT